MSGSARGGAGHEKPIRVMQSVDTWLPQTMTWLHVQTAMLPASVESHILCDATANLDQFALPRLHSLDGTRVGHFLSRHSWRLYALWRRRERARIMCSTRVDLLHSHFGDRGWADLPLVRKTGAAHVVTFYGYDVKRLPTIDSRWHERYAELFASVALVLCEGPYFGRSIAALGCPESKLRVHHLGVRLDDIPFRPLPWTPGQPLKVLIAGTFVEKKGIPYALAAVARLRESTPVEVTLFGDAIPQERSQAEKQAIEAAIARLGLGDVVRHVGFRPYEELLRAAYEHHVFLSPSVTASDGDSEGGAPVTLIEMSASGIQLVSTRHCDIPSVVVDNVTGLLADERDVDALHAALLQLVQERESWVPRAQAARKRVESCFNAAQQGHALAKLYRSVVHG